MDLKIILLGMVYFFKFPVLTSCTLISYMYLEIALKIMSVLKIKPL
jgi:hypothetical protein